MLHAQQAALAQSLRRSRSTTASIAVGEGTEASRIAPNTLSCMRVPAEAKPREVTEAPPPALAGGVDAQHAAQKDDSVVEAYAESHKSVGADASEGDKLAGSNVEGLRLSQHPHPSRSARTRGVKRSGSMRAFQSGAAAAGSELQSRNCARAADLSAGAKMAADAQAATSQCKRCDKVTAEERSPRVRCSCMRTSAA
jgi:hypothetical protein